MISLIKFVEIIMVHCTDTYPSSPVSDQRVNPGEKACLKTRNGYMDIYEGWVADTHPHSLFM